MDIEHVQARLREFAAAREWEPFHTPKNLVMALSGEVGELIAHFQWLTPAESADVLNDAKVAADVRDELADVTLYLLRLADVLGVDLLAEATAKIERNEIRFPSNNSEVN